MGPGTCRKLRALWIMVDMMVSIMRAWGWDDLCKVMAAIQRLKRPRTTCSSQCALEGPSSFLIQNLASPWVEVVGLSNLASPPTCAFTARGGGGYLHCTPTCSPPLLLSLLPAGVRCCITSPTFKFWPNIAQLPFGPTK